LHPTIENAYSAYTNKDLEGALLNYMLAAERGYEVAQSNVAYMLDNSKYE
jgi:SEL1 protein